MNIFSQETINNVVSTEIVLTIACAVILASTFLYYAVDYLLFKRRMEKSAQKHRAEGKKDSIWD